jgi:anti-sigma factor RsiW
MSALVPMHPADAALQRVADGSLRGPEGMAVRAHCDACLECRAELASLEQLLQGLSLLRDPLAPDDFVPGVLLAVGSRERQLAARRHIQLAAIPAALVGLFAAFGWAFSGGVVVRLNELRSSLLVARTAVEVLDPVLEVTRLPLAAGALVAACAILFALSRTLREGPRGPVEA